MDDIATGWQMPPNAGERRPGGPQGVFELNSAGVVAYVDACAAKILGYAPEEVVGRHFSEFSFLSAGPPGLPGFEQRRLGMGGQSEYRLRRKDGSAVWVGLSVPIFDSGSDIFGVSGFVVDIEGRRRREEMAAHEHRLLRQIAANLPIAGVLEDLCLTLEALSHRPLRAAVMFAEATVLKCLAAPSLPPAFGTNRVATRLDDGGTVCAEAIRSGKKVVVGDTGRDGASAEVAALRRDFGIGAAWSYPIIHDGHALGTLAVLLPDAGEPNDDDELAMEFALRVGRLALAHELSARALRASEQRFRDFADLSADWFWEQDAAYRFTNMTGGAFNKGGFRIAAALGKTRWELPFENVEAAIWEEHRAQLERREVFRDFTYSIRVSDGSVRWFSVSGKPVYGPGGEFSGYRGTGRDVTAQKRTEQSLRELAATLESRVRARTAAMEEANSALESFNFSVSHDLRTPLRAIEGFSKALLEDSYNRLDEAGRDYLLRIGAATARMGELIDALYDLSRLLRAPLRLGTVDLSAMARDIIAELREQAPERGVEIDIAATPPAYGDARLLRIALGNLLGNAWKFTGKKTPARIAFGARRDGNGNDVYFVCDDGAGFDMRFAEKLFRMFHRLHRDVEFPGQGIGLTTARRIVVRHGGSIWGEGEPGRGASFCFRLWDDQVLLAEAREAAERA